ncbi:MAG: phospho-N-acetylmuramoyl-pentapeptide-transferase [Firmicutes bacterium]|nr:phospho-N-acetylmuramoyl-pentapeptide-transferase [Bacillota bacterium]MCL1953481.1 phospho-N-acetylmuramoyl-pentapeptide-transferase [Bacillota bacterium]
MTIRLILTAICAFGFTAMLMPIVISLSKKLKMRQVILHFVDNHASKAGTPTMGGSAFILAVSIVAMIFFTPNSYLGYVTVAVFAGYGIIGFLDDFIKIFFKRNLGLNVYQKLVSQLGLAILVAIFAYNRIDIGTEIWLPGLNYTVDIGYWVIPFVIIVFLALTNAVNLVDGLDGLASSVSTAYVICFCVIIVLLIAFSQNLGQSVVNEYNNLLIFGVALIGGLIAFSCFNGYPAKVFMGDTGALALGGALAAMATFSRLHIFVPIIGIMFVLTSLSVLLQVGYYKITKKRIFLMAPLHHHFERKGHHENKIVISYTVVTVLAGLMCVLLVVLINPI